MATVDAIRKITIQASTPGADQATQSLNNLVAAQNRVAASADLLRASMDASQKAVNDNVAQLNALKSANDSAAGGFTGLVSGARDVSGGLADTVEHTLNLINHFKLLGLAAYAMSPALRTITNSGVSAALGTIPPVATQAATSMLSFAAPALSFFARIAVPIGAAVLAWQGLNYTIGLGSGLLDKYGNAERSLFGSDVASNLEKLTTFQNFDSDKVSLSQQHSATQLATTLAEAKQHISDFLNVQLNLTGPALELQSIWVSIVAAIGKAADVANHISLPNTSFFEEALNYFKASQSVLARPGALPASRDGKGDPADASVIAEEREARDARALARRSLAAGLDLDASNQSEIGKYKFKTFTGRFTDDMSQLGDNTGDRTKPADKSDAYDRAKQSIQDQIEVLKQEAEGAGKTSQAVEELKAKHEETIAAMKAGIPVTAAMDAEWKKYGDTIADLTIKLNQAKVVQEETFKSQTMFMSPADTAAAGAAHQIDPTNWQAHINDAGPAMAKLNSELSTARDLTTSFATGFVDAMMRGQSATVALRSEVASLLQSLADAATKGLINSLFAGLSGGSTGTLAGLLSPQFLKFADGGVMTADGPMPLRRYAGGGVASSPQLAMYGEGSQPEAFVPLPNGRSIPVQMGGFKGGGTVTHNINVAVNVSGARGSQEINDTVNAGVQKAIATSAAMLSSYDKGILGRVADNQQRFG